MKKWMSLLVIFMFVGVMASPVIASGHGPSGPAPNSGDGVSDGSGMDAPSGPNGSDSDSASPGPAPNSGDGVSDGSGF
jgi:hypothetical protein